MSFNKISTFFSLFLILFTVLQADDLKKYSASENNYHYSDNETFQKAKEKCRLDLLTQISQKIAVFVSSKSSESFTEINNKSNKTEYKSLTIQYSQAFLKNYKDSVYSIDKNSNKFGMKVWLSLSEAQIKKIEYDVKQELLRRNKEYNKTKPIRDLIKSAESAEKTLRLGDAFKNYFWALLRVKKENPQKIFIDNFDNKSISSELSSRINNIFKEVKFNLINLKYQDGKEILIFEVLRDKQKVANLDIYYKKDKYQVENGVVEIEIDKDLESIPISISYEYATELANYDSSLSKYYKSSQLKPFPESHKEIKRKIKYPLRFYVIIVIIIFLLVLVINRATRGRFTGYLLSLGFLLVGTLSYYYFYLI